MHKKNKSPFGHYSHVLFSLLFVSMMPLFASTLAYAAPSVPPVYAATCAADNTGNTTNISNELQRVWHDTTYQLFINLRTASSLGRSYNTFDMNFDMTKSFALSESWVTFSHILYWDQLHSVADPSVSSFLSYNKTGGYWQGAAGDGTPLYVYPLTATLDGQSVPFNKLRNHDFDNPPNEIRAQSIPKDDNFLFSDGGTGISYSHSGTVNLPADMPAINVGAFAVNENRNLKVTFALEYADGRDAFSDHPDSAANDLDFHGWVYTWSSAAGYDYGDAAGYAVAGHGADSCNGSLYIGDVRPDTESASQTGGSGDSGEYVSDEASLSLRSISGNATSYTADIPYRNNTGAAATLAAWIDFDNDGVFESTERRSVTVNAGSGSATLTWSGLSVGTSLSGFMARFRIASDSTELVSAGGMASNGEVEDHTIAIENITANDDNFTGLYIPGSATSSVLNNDVVNAGPATDALTTTPTVRNNGGLTGVSINSAGNVIIPANAAAGIYSVVYEVCLQSNSAVCDTAIASVEVIGACFVKSDALTASLIPNPDFNDNTGIPARYSDSSFSSLEMAISWFQATEATTDYLHESGYLGGPISKKPEHLGVVSVSPDGGGFIGVITGETYNAKGTSSYWIEYAGAVLKTPMKPSTGYVLNLQLGTAPDGFRYGGPITGNFVIYGVEDASILPLATDTYPSGFSGVDLLFSAPLNMPADTWEDFTAAFKPTKPYEAILIGGEGGEGGYLLMDALTVNEYSVICKSPASMNAVNDSFTGMSAGGVSGSVLSNDIADGSPATDSLVTTPTVPNNGGLSGVTINSNGTVNIPTGALPGNYNVTYRVCLQSDSSVCDTAVVSIEVIRPSSMNAVNDSFTGMSAGDVTGSVLNNDTADGSPATDSLVTTPTVAANGGLSGVTINSNGTVNIPTGAVPGNYNVTYRVCLQSDSSVCDTAVVSIEVIRPSSMNAGNDSFGGMYAGDVTGSVLNNDTADGSPATDSLVTTPTVPNNGGLSGVTINSNGTVNIPTGAVPGNYDVTYRVCLQSDSTVCDTAVISIEVIRLVTMDAVDDRFNGMSAGSVTASVLVNDVADGSPATNSLVTTPTVAANGGLSGVTINSNGTVNIPTSATSGNYDVTYRVCLQADSSVCDTAVVSVEVLAPPNVGGGSCNASTHTDILFIVDNSGSITTSEYADFSASIQRVGNQVLADNSSNRIAVMHFGGPGASMTEGGQYIYIERDFSNTAVQPPVRQFGHGGAYNVDWTKDHLSAAIARLQYAIDGDPGTAAPTGFIVSPIKEMARDRSIPLQIVIMTDADRYYRQGDDISVLIDPPGSAAEPDDGSDFTIYNQLKRDGVSFSVVSFTEYDNAEAASAAIASVGGVYKGSIDANPLDPEGSQKLPRKYLPVSSGFVLTPEQVSAVAYDIAESCGGESSGTIFEDLNYGGGNGRAFGTAGMVGLSGAYVEAYDKDGYLLRTVQSGVDGAYQFSGLPDGNYFIRVVNSTVDSSRAGGNGSEMPVMTYRSDGTNAVRNEVGGRYPALVDAPVNNDNSRLNISNFIFSSGSLRNMPAQSVQRITVSGVDVKNANFGFSFNAVVNTNASGQGSLQQFVQNNNSLSGTGITQQLPAQVAGDYTTGDIVTTFMIPVSQLNASDEAIIKPQGALVIRRPGIVIDGRTQSANKGAGTIALEGGNSGIYSGVEFYNANGSVLRDIAIRNFTGSGVIVNNAAVIIWQNTISNSGHYGVLLENGAKDSAVIANTIHNSGWAGIANDASVQNIFSQNSLTGNGGLGIDLGVDGVTSNDNADRWLNYPEVGSNSSISTNGSTVVAYDFDLDVPANAAGYRVEFFSNNSVDPSGHGEGLNYLGYVDISPQGNGPENFKGSLNANAAVPGDANVALTLTSITSGGVGSTSEFSTINNGNVSVCTDVLTDPNAPLQDVAVDENSPVLTYLEALDANGDPITYVISGGADGDKFIINAPQPGALFDCATVEFIVDDLIVSARTPSPSLIQQRAGQFAPAPGDYEVPTDSGSDNTYELLVTAIDSNGNQVTRPLNIMIQDVNEAPRITIPPVISFTERQQGVIVDLNAYDPDAGDAEGSGLTYRINGGTDAGYFTIDTDTGEVRFNNEPDFDTPLDQNADNSYELSVKVSDDQGYSSSTNLSVLVTDDPANNGIKLRARVMLQGAYESDTGLMHDLLRVKGVLPVAHPYQNAPFNHAGTEQINLDLVTVEGSDAIVDWVLLELRSVADPAQVVSSIAALVQRDGDVVDAATGQNSLMWLNASAGEYHVSVRHRNHLGVMTAEPLFIDIADSSSVIDFTQVATTVTGGVTSRLMAAANDSDIALLWSGDINQDQRLIALGQGSDINLILSDVFFAPGNTDYNSSYQVEGYSNTDLNMDGVALFMGPGNDANILLGNVFLHPANDSFFGNFVVAGGLSQ